MQRAEGAHEEVRVANQFRVCVIGGRTEVPCSMQVHHAAGAFAVRGALHEHLIAVCNCLLYGDARGNDVRGIAGAVALRRQTQPTRARIDVEPPLEPLVLRRSWPIRRRHDVVMPYSSESFYLRQQARMNSTTTVKRGLGFR